MFGLMIIDFPQNLEIILFYCSRRKTLKWQFTLDFFGISSPRPSISIVVFFSKFSSNNKDNICFLLWFYFIFIFIFDYLWIWFRNFMCWCVGILTIIEPIRNILIIIFFTTKIATGWRTKNKILKKRFGSRHHSYYRKLWKTIKKRPRSTKTNFGYVNWLCVGKVLTPYNARPKTVSLIKIQMDVVSFKCLFFKTIKKENSKENKKRFLFFGPDKDYSLLLHISIHNGQLGSCSSI